MKTNSSKHGARRRGRGMRLGMGVGAGGCALLIVAAQAYAQDPQLPVPPRPFIQALPSGDAGTPPPSPAPVPGEGTASTPEGAVLPPVEGAGPRLRRGPLGALPARVTSAAAAAARARATTRPGREPAPGASATPSSAAPSPPSAGSGSSGAITLAQAPTMTVDGVAAFPGEKEFNQCRKLPPSQRIVKLNLKPDTDILDLIGWISSITCTQFIYTSATQISGKKVTVISPERITPAEAYRLFYAALDSVGLTVEPTGRFLRIIDTNRARFSALPIYGDKQGAPRDKRFVTKLVHIKHIDANALVTTLLNRVKGQAGDIIAYQSAVIITDEGENVARMVELIEEFDRPGMLREKVWLLRIKNTTATEMAARLAEILPVEYLGSAARRAGQARGGAAGVAPAPAPTPTKKDLPPGDLEAEMGIKKIIPDERSNQLLVIASDRAYEWLRAVVEKLDIPIEGGGDGKFHIYYCENANCDELAATLAAVAGVQVVGASGQSARRSRTTRAGTQAAAAPALPATAGQQNQQGAPLLFEGDVRITFDAPTNALLILSSFKDYQSLRSIIEKLDAPRKQVFVEAMILEVLLDKSRELGVAFHGGKPIDVAGRQSLLLGGFEAQKTLSPASLVSDLSGLTAALFGPPLEAATSRLFGVTVDIPSFGALVQLLQTNNDVNVLSNPHILITNNQEGMISVGQNIPLPGASFGGAGGLGTALGGQAAGLSPFLGGFGFTPVNRQDVTLEMKLVPSVNEHDVIRLDVEQKIQDIASADFNGLGASITKREASTTVVCRDQQTVVIGGLMTDRTLDQASKVPILGDIPVIGFFFRSTKKVMQKSNIIIALTPYVITDLGDLRRVTEKKMRERREFIERYSALEDRVSLDADIDFRRKRGMLEEINREMREIEYEENELRQIRERDLLQESTPIEIPSRRSRAETGAAAPAPQPVTTSADLDAPAPPAEDAPASLAGPRATTAAP